MPDDAVRLEHGLGVPVDPQPDEALENRPRVLLRRAGLIGVLYPQQELAAGLAGEKPVEDGGAGTADMQVAGRGGSEANAHGIDAVKGARDVIGDARDVVGGRSGTPGTPRRPSGTLVTLGAVAVTSRETSANSRDTLDDLPGETLGAVRAMSRKGAQGHRGRTLKHGKLSEWNRKTSSGRGFGAMWRRGSTTAGW